MILWVAGTITGIRARICGGGMCFLIFHHHIARHSRIKPYHI